MTALPIAVLMVEDNPGDAQLIREYLGPGTRDSYRIDHCSRLDDAVLHLAHQPCDVILLDLSLPDSRGLSTFDAIQERAAGIPVVILTGIDDEVIAAQAIKHGAKDFLPKHALDGKLLERAIRYAMDRAQWEQTIRQSDERIGRLERMEAIGRLSAGIAHHFNNLLTVILGNCDLLAGSSGSTEQMQHYIRLISDTAKRASTFTRSVMAFGRNLPVMPRIFDLNASMRELEPLIRGALGRDIRIHLELHPETDQVHADPAQIEQVVLNLVLNARDAIHGGGAITLRTLPIDLAAGADGIPDGIPPGRYAAIVVSDTGCGIEASLLQRIFEPFFTTKEEYLGSGMGLATVSGMISQNHGYIQVISQPGAGSTFTIYLPRRRHVEAGEAASSGVPGDGHETILLVEDDPDIRELMAHALGASGYRVHVAADGTAGLALFTRHRAEIAAVVSDVAMPGINGYLLLRAIRAVDVEIPVILMTGQPGGFAAEAAASARLLSKPFTPSMLESLLREELNRSASRSQLPAR